LKGLDFFKEVELPIDKDDMQKMKMPKRGECPWHKKNDAGGQPGGAGVVIKGGLHSSIGIKGATHSRPTLGGLPTLRLDVIATRGRNQLR